MIEFAKVSDTLTAIKRAISEDNYHAPLHSIISLMISLGLHNEALVLHNIRLKLLSNEQAKELVTKTLLLICNELPSVLNTPPVMTTYKDIESLLIHKLEFFALCAANLSLGRQEPVKLAEVLDIEFNKDVVSTISALMSHLTILKLRV